MGFGHDVDCGERSRQGRNPYPHSGCSVELVGNRDITYGPARLCLFSLSSFLPSVFPVDRTPPYILPSSLSLFILLLTGFFTVIRVFSSLSSSLPSLFSHTMGGILHLVEDRPTPKNVYNWRVYVLALIASCGSNMIGYTSGFIGTTITLPSFEREFGLDKMTSSHVDLISENIVSLFIAGAFFGALLTYGISHVFGRKWSLTISSAVFILGAGLQMGANGSRGLGILYAGRVLSGLGTGVASNVVPIYLSELAPPAIRGRLVGFYELGWQVGGMVGFWINVSGFPFISC